MASQCSHDVPGAGDLITPLGDFIDHLDPLQVQRSSQAPFPKSTLDFYLPLWLGEAPARALTSPPRERDEVSEKQQPAPLPTGSLEGGDDGEECAPEERRRLQLEEHELKLLKQELEKALRSEELNDYHRQLVEYVLEEPATEDCFHGRTLPVDVCARVRVHARAGLQHQHDTHYRNTRGRPPRRYHHHHNPKP